jgi:hypothetical protein
MTLSELLKRSPFEEYRVDQVLTLNVVLPGHDQASSSSQILVRVRQLQSPRTLSCTMIVDILDQSQSAKTAFLKLYDRRFADQFRRDWCVAPWTKDMEEDHVRFVRSGAIHGFLHKLHTDESFLDQEGAEWDHDQNEAFLGDEMLKIYKAETATYGALRDYQGHLIPRLLAAVDLRLTPPNVEEASQGEEPDSDFFHVKGVLLEYIQGFTMSDIDVHAPRSAWQDIVDQALGIVRVLGDRNILNRDVRHGNFMISPKGNNKYQVFMIDFGQCRLRGKDETDFDWGRAKYRQDEEGAVGLVMKKRLGDHGFKLHYEISERYLQWAERE